MDNKLVIAAAGSGKTTELIKEALSIKSSAVLISSYTEANANEIKNKFIKENGCIPSNITIQTWFSLLIQHGIKPFQSYLFEEKIKGMILVSQQSALRYKNQQGFPVYWGEKDFHKHYFTKDMRIYSDKLSKLVCRINTESKGKVIDRLINIFPTIFIDECQDLAGYDLDLIKLLAINESNLKLVCDPRQVTYLTHHESRYKKYRNGLIKEFIINECKKINFSIDENTLSHSYRCNQSICDFSNQLYPDIHQCNSHQTVKTEHDGVFLIDIKDRDKYLELYNPIQLRWNINNTMVNFDFPAYNFGQSKGLTFDRVLIYPTKDMTFWLKNHSFNLHAETKAKFYVGITRAKYSVGIVCDLSEDYDMSGLEIFKLF